MAKTRTERFCEALGRCIDIDSVAAADDGTITVRSNGGGITLTPTMAPLGLKPAHPDQALCSDTPSAIARAFRQILGAPYLGFSGTSNLKPEVSNVECTVDTRGDGYLMVGKTSARQEVYKIDLWRCEKVARGINTICAYSDSEYLAALAG